MKQKNFTQPPLPELREAKNQLVVLQIRLEKAVMMTLCELFRSHYTDGQPLIRMVKDHVAIERVLAELEIISSPMEHREYLDFLAKTEHQMQIRIPHTPKVSANLSYYVHDIRACGAYPAWTDGTTTPANFRRLMAIAGLLIRRYPVYFSQIVNLCQ